MKPTFKTIIFSSVLLTFAVGCGKDEKSSSAPAPVKKTTTTVTSALNQEGKAAYNSFKTWYASKTNGGFPGLGLYLEERTVFSYDSSSNCTDQPIKIFGEDLGSIQTCSFGSGSNGEAVVEKQVAVFDGAAKSSNKLLERIYKGSEGKLITASKSQGMYLNGKVGELYRMKFQKTDGTLREYWIDTGIHSAFQPIKSFDSSTNTESVLTDISLN